MNIVEASQLMKRYNTCENCGNENVGNGEGIITIENNYFKRSCKCGWSIEISKRIKVRDIHIIGEDKVFECYENDGQKELSCKHIPMALLKEKGIIKTISQTKKLEEYLNSDEGVSFYKSIQTKNVK